MTQAEFDRVRPRRTGRAAPTEPSALPVPAAPTTVDSQGRRALFSTEAPAPSFGCVAVTCSSCRQTSVLTFRQTARMLVPSLHLPLLRRDHPSLMRCPACSRLTWLRLRVRL